MPAPAIIHQLVAKFEENRAAYRSGKYNEARLRQEFLDPFFAALGWDVYNEKGVAPEYADVIIEDSLSFEGSSRAPDYAFKIGRERKFYVEAKKPAVDIQYDIHPAYQLRRYAWNAHLPLSILTDFEDFAVYNCKAKPNPTDSSATSREMLIHYPDYVARWDEIAAVFSRDAVWKGALDRYAETSKGKKGTTEVDDEFLKDMNEWRVTLARNIALRNPQVADEHQLNYAVQMTIDRVIFLRICEDRGIEPEEQLKTIAASPNIYAGLLELFKRADLRYNSGLFHFNAEKGNTNHPDTFTPTLKIDDRVLKEIIHSIYYPCPYIFKEIPVEILGQVYEQFLGQVIRLTAGHQAKVEEKPEVRKAGGVYYTPRYIVDYIVANTVGKLLEGKTPEQAASLKIVDPACGSGSFLLGAFQYLIDWHEQWYLANDPGKWTRGKAPALNEVTGGYRLTTLKKKEILLNNLHGVDIDPQAVEVTKLSLLLKVLEEESGQLSLGLERALPDLGRNIQCGNSLIGEDYFAGQLTVDPAERRRVNPFEWREAFPGVFAQGGFDAVIGNPPYVRAESLDVDFKKYFRKFKSHHSNADIYVYFYEISQIILESEGYFGFISSNKFIKTDYGNPLRKFLSKSSTIVQLIDFGELPVFENVGTFPTIIIGRNGKSDKSDLFVAQPKTLSFSDLDTYVNEIKINLKQEILAQKRWMFIDDKQLTIIRKIEEKGKIFRDYQPAKIFRGILTGMDKAFIIEKSLRDEILEKNPTSIDHIKPYLLGDFIRKFRINDKGKYLIYFEKGWTKKNIGYSSVNRNWSELSNLFPMITQHIEQYRESCINRFDQGDYWWELRGCDYYDLLSQPKIIWPEIAKESRFTYDDSGYFLNKTCFFTPSDNLFLLAILNSKLIWFYLKHTCSVLGDVNKGGRLMQQKIYIEQIPIINVDKQENNQSTVFERIQALANSILILNKQTPATPREHEQLQRQIAATDRQIDSLVYQLYGLTDAEIALVEGSS